MPDTDSLDSDRTTDARVAQRWLAQVEADLLAVANRYQQIPGESAVFGRYVVLSALFEVLAHLGAEAVKAEPTRAEPFCAGALAQLEVKLTGRRTH